MLTHSPQLAPLLGNTEEAQNRRKDASQEWTRWWILTDRVCLRLFTAPRTSAGHGDGVPDNHGDARGILEKHDTTTATV
jgi:hypothetical protein